jgi:uncharacterized membrane protein
MKRNTDYKNDALAALKGNWGKAVLATVIYMVIVYIAMGPYLTQSFKFQAAMTAAGGAMDAQVLLSEMSTLYGYLGLYWLFVIFLIAPLMVGFVNAFRALLVQGDREIPTNMYKIATKGYWHKVWGMFLMGVFVFLWSLLFVIPGIIKAFSYAMTPFILEEHPELSANEAIDHSRAMMKGHKFDLFWLYLSFIGWGILCIFTLGIGLLWLVPYMQTAQSSFYEDVKADYEANGGLI